MIYHELQCIYIHIPKTAGTSIETKLGGHKTTASRLKQDHRTIRNLKGAIPPWQMRRWSIRDWLVFVNQRYKAYKSGVGFVSREQFENYFKFSIVRNPWERAYSWYRNVIRDSQHQSELGLTSTITFEDFLLKHGDQWALRTQLDWLVDEAGAIEVDFIGKFENLEQDFAQIAQRLGISDNRLPKVLHSRRASYIEVYDENLKQVVAERYKKEIEMFGYTFGG